MTEERDRLHVVTNDDISAARTSLGRGLIWGSAGLLVLVALAQALDRAGLVDLGFANWRPTLYAYVLWAICLCWGQVLMRGEQGKRVLFVLPAVLFGINPGSDQRCNAAAGA